MTAIAPLYSDRWRVVGALALANIIGSLDMMFSTVALPTIASDFKLPLVGAAWIPLSGTRNGGKPERAGFTNCSTRRSEIFPISEIAIAAKSRANAKGWPWKFPPERMSPSSGKTKGLSVAELISRAKTERA